MKTYKITRAQLLELYDAACGTWKPKIQDITYEVLGHFANEGDIPEKEVKKMFDASNTEQRKLLKSIFTEYDQDKNAFVRAFQSSDIQQVSRMLFNDPAALEINTSSLVCGRVDLTGKAFWVRSGYAVKLLSAGNGGTVIEIIKK